MIKKIALSGLGLVLLVAPSFALAQVDVQSQIASLLAQIKQLQALILQLQGQSSTPTTGTASCLDLNNALIIGSTDATTNGEVTKLQRFLGAYKVNKLYTMAPDNQSGASSDDRQPVTGYYGSKTAANVMEWQKAHGMDFVTLTSGVGPMTRAKMKCGSTGAPAITKVEWRIEPANPSATDSYKKDEQAIFVDVIRSDNSVRGYSVGKAYGCAASSNLPAVPGKKVLGFVNCYYALSGVAFTAYEANGKFIVERGDESAKDGSVIKTVVLEI